MDSIIDCGLAAAKEAQATNITLTESPQCGGVTGFTEIFVRPGPSAVFFNAIFPLKDPTTVVGFIGTSINFAETLTNVVPDFVDGLDCVISDQDGRAFTYVIHNGIPELIGEGDHHDRSYTSHGQSIVLNDIDTGATASATFTLTVYPTQTMFDEFRTHIPIIASIGFVTVIFVCTCIFFLYDYFMKYESHQQQKILQVKRRFVRFISHEIRTPLNVVSMGLSLLQTELRDKLEDEKCLVLLQQTTTGTATVVRPALPQVPQKTPADHNDHATPILKPSHSSGALSTASAASSYKVGNLLNSQKKGRGSNTSLSSQTSSSRKRFNNSASNLQELAAAKPFPPQPSSAQDNVDNVTYWLQLAEEIHENAQNAVSVLNDLLTYDKVESGTFALDLGRVDILTSIKKTVKEFAIQARNRRVKLQLFFEQQDHPANEDLPPDEVEYSLQVVPPQGTTAAVVTGSDDAALPVPSNNMATLRANAAAAMETTADHLQGEYNDQDFFHDPESIFVLGDERRLFQVIRNLVSNSLKFTPEEQCVTVTVCYIEHGLEHAEPSKQMLEQMGRAGPAQPEENGAGHPHPRWAPWKRRPATTNDVDHHHDADSPEEGGNHKNDSKHLDHESKESSPPRPRRMTDVEHLMSTSDRDGSIRITVKDDGVGLSSDQLKLLFNEGVQFNPNVLQHGGGSGLGLAITKEFVLMHGGTIEAHSPGLGHGSTFTVELPLYRELPAPAAPEDMPTTVIGSATSMISQDDHDVDAEDHDLTHHVLVVDDVLTNTKMLVRLLERAGHTCEVAEHGQEAIAVYLANQEAVENQDTGSTSNDPPRRRFDTILMDFEMPIMNGPEATKRLREMGCKADIFGVTGNVLTEDVMTFKASGADMVLYKPINLQSIDAAWDNMDRLRR